MTLRRLASTGNPHWLSLLLGTAAGLLLAGSAHGQQSPPLPVKVKNIQVGFRGYSLDDSAIFKPGLWTPVYVTLEQSLEVRQFLLPVGADEYARGQLAIGSNDSDDVQGTYHTDFSLRKTDGSVLIQSYANPATLTPQLQMNLTAGSNRYSFQSSDIMNSLELGQYLYLTIGNRTPDLHKTLIAMSANPKDESPAPRFAAYETQLERLPTEWFGYQAVDLMVLLTDNRKFTEGLAGDEVRIGAIADWVRRGGRLVISVSPANQEALYKILNSAQWQPALPALLGRDEQVSLTSMAGVTNWADAFDDLFPASKKNPVPAAKLKPTKATEVLLQEASDPLMVRVPYGRGSVTMIAFPLDRAPFLTWNGRGAFWKKLVLRLAPRVQPVNNPDQPPLNPGFGGRRGGFGETSENDLTTQLHQELDQFNVPQISFGWVALFILIFILIVGPLDFVLLFYVFKRPEWTWITFPVVVIAITIISYFTAYALKGNDLKINKVDLVDIDLRTALDKDNKTAKAYAYGTTWFAILSPRIQDYTIGVEPALGTWAKSPEANPQMNNVMVTWMGRAERYGAGAFGRQRSASLFRRVYDYAPEATGLKQVPIPVWTTKAFWASWEVKCGESPFSANFSYRVSIPEELNGSKLWGTIQNNLPIPLTDCFLFYGDKYYPVSNLPARSPDGKPFEIKLEGHQGSGIEKWAQQQTLRRQQPFVSEGRTNYFAPETIIRRFYFYDRNISSGGDANHVQRVLDQTWRVADIKPGDTSVRTAILVGKLARAEGDAKALTEKNDPRLPSHLWLGTLPGSGENNEVLGTLIQETYIRVFIPVRPDEK